MNKIFFLFILILITTLPKAIGQDQDTISIENVNIIPMTKETVLYKQRVLISDGKIIKIEPSSSSLTDKVSLTIDATDKYLIPGLSEMHYHYRSNDIRSDLKLLLANGITTLRNMAELDGQDQIAIRQKVASGEILGPNYYTTGPYLKSEQLRTKEEVTAVVKMHKERGYDFLKIADNLPLDIYLKLLEECDANNVQIIGHSQRNLPLEFSLRMKSIEHIEEFLYLSDENNNPILKQTKDGLNALAQQLYESGIYIGTTLVGFDFIKNCLEDGKFTAFRQDSLVKYLAKKEREDFLTERNDYRKLKDLEFDGVKAPILFNTYFIWMKDFSKILSDNKVRLLTGCDTYGMVIVGLSLHKEFEFLQQAGMKPYDILLASTVNPARYLGKYSMEGTIAERKNANLVLLNKNPLDDIQNTRFIAGVILKGKWLDRTTLNKMLKEVEMAFK